MGMKQQARMDAAKTALAEQHGGGRQYGTEITKIKKNHRLRYEWARGILDSTSRVLDAGCGIGYGSALLAEKVKHVYGFEFKPGVVEEARSHYGKDNVNYYSKDLHDAPRFAGGLDDIDAIVAFEVLEHLILPASFLVPVAREGRSLICSVPNSEKVGQPSCHSNPYHVRHYTPDEFLSLLVSCGWKVISMWSQDFDKPGPLRFGAKTVLAVCEGTKFAPDPPSHKDLLRAYGDRVFELADHIYKGKIGV